MATIPCDGFYPFDSRNFNWDMVVELPESAALTMAAMPYITNKGFRVIKRDDHDFDYIDWNDEGRKAESFYKGALAIYKHDDNYWLIQCNGQTGF